MTLQELSGYLETTVALTVGVNLFRGQMPITTTEEPAVVLSVRGGSKETETRFGAPDLRYEWPRVRVTTRGAPDHRVEADVLAYAVYKALGKVQAQTLAGTFYHQITCLQPPYFDREDTNRRPIIAFDIECAKELSA